MAEDGLDEATVSLILLHERVVLGAQSSILLSLDSDLAFELGDVFCVLVSKYSFSSGNVDLPFLRERNARAETLLRS